MTPSRLISFGAALLLLIAAPAYSASLELVDEIPIAPVWSGHPVGFALYTENDDQFAAYYGADRTMTLAHRKRTSRNWDYAQLPERVGWDSHNRIVMAIDSAGYIHLWGNMHCVPLVYFRSQRPGDITSMTRIEHMVGTEENRVTYPQIVPTSDERLIFTYRDGSSGSGNQIYDVYDTASQRWQRLLDTPLTDGRGEMNAYFDGPRIGPDGRYHLCWVWRNTPDCETNHTICYAQSDDLVHWKRADGSTVELPITIETADVVDDTPPGGGLLNGNVRLGFDSSGRVLISYHKYDEDGRSQLYIARHGDGEWNRTQISDWDFRWEFSGRGTIQNEVRIPPATLENDHLVQRWSTQAAGSGAWTLDEHTLQITGDAPARPGLPRSMTQVRSEFPGIGVRGGGDSGPRRDGDLTYQLRWETLGSNRDQPRQGTLPPPSTLSVCALRTP